MAAPWSATQLVLFRRAVAPVARRIFIGNVRHFYSPADVVTSLALNWLDEWLGGWSDRADRPPLFLMLHYMDPHAPYMNGKRRGELLGRLLISESQMSRRREAVLAAYTGDIEFMDEHLGTLFERLRTLGLFEEMVVVFTSDHGEELGEHGFWGHGFSLSSRADHA